MNPFDYLKTINETKEDIMVDDVAEKGYNPFIINRGLSYFPDTVMVANELNQNTHLPSKVQYKFLLSIVRKRKRFSKWAKAETETDLEIIKEYYGYSTEKAREISHLLSKDQIQQLSQRMYKGGKA